MYLDNTPPLKNHLSIIKHPTSPQHDNFLVEQYRSAHLGKIILLQQINSCCSEKTISGSKFVVLLL
jgi:hypothetical protein